MHQQGHCQCVLCIVQELNPNRSDLGLSPQKLKAFTSFYSSMPQLLIDREELQAHFTISDEGVCFRSLLSLTEKVQGTPQTFEHTQAVAALVTKLFDTLSRWASTYQAAVWDLAFMALLGQ
jgi:hypothetical protein